MPECSGEKKQRELLKAHTCAPHFMYPRARLASTLKPSQEDVEGGNLQAARG